MQLKREAQDSAAEGYQDGASWTNPIWFGAIVPAFEARN
jgi:hypothetical protein